jgi:hypothetical protein
MVMFVRVGRKLFGIIPASSVGSVFICMHGRVMSPKYGFDFRYGHYHFLFKLRSKLYNFLFMMISFNMYDNLNHNLT